MTRNDSIRGAALQNVLHVVLILVVLGQIVFLASRTRARFDMTGDGAFTLTASTKRILSELEERLVMECYFSPKESLPAQLRDARTVLDNILDEYVQLAGGKVVVQRFDPNSDKMVEEKARRIGIKPADLPSRTSSSFQVNTAWQGIRLVYGGQRQKVLEQIGAASSSQLEAALTPAIREVLTKVRHKVGFMEWPMDPPPGQKTAGAGWGALRGIPEIAKRYEFVNVKDAEGVLIPEDIDTVFLYRPKNLTDRQKYVIDQFLMRGGKLVIFADVADYQIGPYRTFTRVQGFLLDEAGSKVKWLEQLASYGVEIKEKIVGDASEAMSGAPGEYMCLVRQNPFGQLQPQPVVYPYFFHAMAVDWRLRADQFAMDPKTRSVDRELADRYRQTLRPGIDSDEFLFLAFKKKGRGPGFYWPCWTDLRRKGQDPDLPEGVKGRVLLWSSPETIVEDPPMDMNPIRGQDARTQNASYEKFVRSLNEKLLARAQIKGQAPLMVDLQGRFHSYFDGKERPLRASEKKEQEAAAKAAAEAKEQGGASGAAPADDAVQPPKVAPPEAKTGKADAPKKGGPRWDPKESGAPAAAPQQPAKPAAAPQGPIGPQPPPKKDDAELEKKIEEPAPLLESTAEGRIVVVGDSDFLRDDMVRGEYAQRGGPVSTMGGAFFYQLLDWLAQDRDLVELQSRVPVSRALELVEQHPGEAPIEFERRRDAKQTVLQIVNILLPIGILGGVGIALFLSRRAQKRAFLSRCGQLSEGIS
ncbi:MAG: hypothetical protein Fur0037_07870 [Planctomycetota bacterium]